MFFGTSVPQDTSSFKAIEREPRYSVTSRVTSPPVTLTLAQRDDAAEYDDDAQHDTNELVKYYIVTSMTSRLTVYLVKIYYLLFTYRIIKR